MAPLALFYLMEVPTTRLPNVKMLLDWPSRMYIYGFVEITLYLCTMHWSLAPSEAIDVCFSKHQSALLGGDGDSSSTAGLQARGYRPVRR